MTAVPDANEKQFTTISCKKKKPIPPTLIPKSLPYVDREIMITVICKKITTETEHQKSADYTLSHFNSAISILAEINQLPLTLGRINSNNKLVLMTNPTTPASAYIPYMLILLNEIKSLKPTTGHMNSHWTKFLIHNVPTTLAPDRIGYQIERTYPTLHLIQDPQWLVPTEYCLNKTSSTIVISLQGAIDLIQLGISHITIQNCIYYITEYFS
jgi:hypothetical protein